MRGAHRLPGRYQCRGRVRRGCVSIGFARSDEPIGGVADRADDGNDRPACVIDAISRWLV
jgi:hypothetical protein